MIIGGCSLQTLLVREIHDMWEKFQLDFASTEEKNSHLMCETEVVVLSKNYGLGSQ